jgi:predicted ribosomally synthesized peptide with SipW-like signal peptide
MSSTTVKTASSAARRFTPATIIRSILAIGSVLGVGTVLTLAAWSDSGTATATFSTGTLDLQLNGADNVPDFVALDLTNMGDGASVTAPLTVKNNGTLRFGYTMSVAPVTPATDNNTLYQALHVVVKSATLATDCTAANWGNLTTTIVADTTIGSAAIASRTLTAGSSEVLCFQVTLPSGSNNNVQNKTTHVLMTFNATQN